MHLPEPAGRVLDSLSTRGAANTARLALRWGAWSTAPGLCRRVERTLVRRGERHFDRRFRTDTASVAAPAADAPLRSRDGGTKYEATTAGSFRLLVRALEIDPAEWLFVDVGCGKGKAMLLAAEQGFREVVGLEHSPSLAEIAATNVSRYRRARRGAPPMTCLCGDARAFQAPDMPTVFWLFNPFAADTLARFVARMGACLGETTPVRLVYLNPLHESVLEATPWLRRTARVETWLQDSAVIYARRD